MAMRMLKDNRELADSFIEFADVMVLMARKTALTFATTLETYMVVEKNISKREKFITELEALDKKFEKSLSIELTEAQKMGKKLGRNTVEMMKAIEAKIIENKMLS